jgi:hypothetical protein
MRTLVIVGLIGGAVAVFAPDQGRRAHALDRARVWLGDRA